jgi:membrane protein
MSEFPSLRLLLQRLWRTMRLTCREFLGDRCFDKSAALAYVSLLGIFALMTVLLSITAVIFQDDTDEMVARVEHFLLARLLPTAALFEEDELGVEMMFPLTLDQMEELEKQEAAKDILEANIVASFRQLVGMFEGLRQMAEEIGTLGFVGLIFLTMTLFTSIEKGFNEVFHVRRKRPLVRAMITYMGVLVWAALAAGVSLVMAFEFTDRFVVLSPGLIGVGVTCAAFAVAYFLIPNTRVLLPAALVGGLLAGAVWELSKQGFMVYLLNAPAMGTLLPILGVLPVFLIWLYATWVVVFLGLEFTYVLQHYSPLAGRVFQSEAAIDLNPRHILMALCELGNRFERGDPVASVAHLMKVTHQNEYQVHALLDHCESQGWVAASKANTLYHLRAEPDSSHVARRILAELSPGRGVGPAGENPQGSAVRAVGRGALRAAGQCAVSFSSA